MMFLVRLVGRTLLCSVILLIHGYAGLIGDEVLMAKVLLIVESCNPDWSSVPLVGYNFFREISGIADVTLVTHSRNKLALLNRHPNCAIHFIEPGYLEDFYYKLITALSTFRGRVVWPLRHMLQFPLYFFFDRSVTKLFASRVQSGEFDIVHVLTPMMPRYPVGLVGFCRNTPLILGPVNGGVPFPQGFKALGKKEFSQLNFLRSIGAHLIPNYKNTYKHADLILAGSSYTRSWIIKEFGRTANTTLLVYENAVPADFYDRVYDNKPHVSFRLLFVGRLVPYKGADMLLRALSVSTLNAKDFVLDIVGDGPELERLKDLSETLGLSSRVNFAGWISQNETSKYYKNADVFCFPSVREFGGAVVMEAMAFGLPCVVVDNGGIGEYVTAETGYKIAPVGEAFVIDAIAGAVIELMENPDLLRSKSEAAATRAKSFSWACKGDEINTIYATHLPPEKSISTPSSPQPLTKA